MLLKTPVLLCAAFVLTGLSGCAEDAGSEQVQSSDKPLLVLESFEGPAEVDLGLPAVYEAQVRNGGPDRASFALFLLVDGTSVSETTVTLGGGVMEKVRLDFDPSATGSFMVSFTSSPVTPGAMTQAFHGGLPLKVEAPYVIDVLNAVLGEKEVAVGGTVSVEATVQNLGGPAQNVPIRLFVDGSLAGTRHLNLSAEQSAHIVFTYHAQSRGLHEVQVEDRVAGTLDVYLPATFEVQEFQALTDRVEAGEEATLLLSIRNVGDRGGTVGYQVKRGGAVLKSANEYVAPDGSTGSKELRVLVDWSGASTLSLLLDGQTVRDVSVTGIAASLSATQIKTPYNSGYACYDYAYTRFSIVNAAGAGTARNVWIELHVDGVAKNVEGWSGTRFSLSDLKPGETLDLTSDIKMHPVTDVCGQSDPHTFVIKMYADYAGIRSSSPVEFVL